MNISESMESEIWEWDINQLWKAFSMIAENNPNFLKEWEMVLNGVKIECDIGYYLEEYYKTIPKNKSVYIEGHAEYPIGIFWADKRARENIMREIILDNLAKIETVKPRVEEED